MLNLISEPKRRHCDHRAGHPCENHRAGGESLQLSIAVLNHHPIRENRILVGESHRPEEVHQKVGIFEGDGDFIVAASFQDVNLAG